MPVVSLRPAVASLVFVSLVVARAPYPSAAPGGVDLSGMRYRLVGPFRGGRAVTVAGVVHDPATYYAGTAGGGVWKTTDAGATWRPISDGQPFSAVGAVAVAESDPRTIWVGTGEACI